jgi:hypothetical protein
MLWSFSARVSISFLVEVAVGVVRVFAARSQLKRTSLLSDNLEQNSPGAESRPPTAIAVSGENPKKQRYKLDRQIHVIRSFFEGFD